MKIVFIIIFFIILFIPVILFNRDKNAVSEIDNKVLAANPLSADAAPVENLPDALSQYVSERVGLRNQMIKVYTQLNDKLFGEMVHPTYAYGKDGYIFFKPGAVKTYSEFEDAFVNMVCELQKYCDDRDIPFVFVFEPSKMSILREYLPDGYNYNNDWVDTFLGKLEENNINYVDNTKEMLRCKENQIQVFNVKYNAGHWNDMGAFYGVNQVLINLKKQMPTVHVNEMDEYEITQKLNTTLQVSQFPIYEYEPVFKLINDNSITNITSLYADEIEIDKSFPYFSYVINSDRKKENAPKALVFQGSYINGMGYKFFQNAFGEYIQVHDYQNILNFDYYMNIFNPECVVFEVAEYTFVTGHFNYYRMKDFNLSPLSSLFNEYKVEYKHKTAAIDIQKGNALTKIKLSNLDIDSDYAYAFVENTEYDMHRCTDEGTGKYYYELTLCNENYIEDEIKFMLVDTQGQTRYYIE